MRINDLIESIKKRPALYISGDSINRLKSFLDGYFFAINLYKIETEDIEFWSDFQSWINNYYKITTSQSWAQIILFFSTDEYHALNEFFKLFDEFLNTRDRR
jgi:hypothetical protein